MTDLMDRIEQNINFREATCDVPSQLDHELIKRVAKQWKPRHKVGPKTPRLGKKQAAAIRYAAHQLDEVESGWENKINQWTIILLSERRCVLGQIFGSYHDGLDAYGSSSTKPGGVFVFIGDNIVDRHFIKKAWRREIRARR